MTEVQPQPPAFKDQLLRCVPALRAFGMSLSGRRDIADDLVQETLMKGWEYQSSFAPDSNIKAWLFTILRNEFLSMLRKRKREIEDPDGLIALQESCPPEQIAKVAFSEFERALDVLPRDQREAIVLVGASGFSYEEAAAICDVAVGTIKSRVNRARTRLTQILKDDTVDIAAPHPVQAMRARVSAGT
jgi:RNA polymerase sigma-70 factor, ECF subfamily